MTNKDRILGLFFLGGSPFTKDTYMMYNRYKCRKIFATSENEKFLFGYSFSDDFIILNNGDIIVLSETTPNIRATINFIFRWSRGYYYVKKNIYKMYDNSLTIRIKIKDFDINIQRHIFETNNNISDMNHELLVFKRKNILYKINDVSTFNNYLKSKYLKVGA